MKTSRVGSPGIDLKDCGIDRLQAADLRARLATFAKDWERPEMDVYDREESFTSGSPSPRKAVPPCTAVERGGGRREGTDST